MSTWLVRKETWRTVRGYEGCYKISSIGRIFSLPRKVKCGYGKTRTVRGRFIKPNTDEYGYLYFNASKNNTQETMKVHRAVAGAFIPNPNNLPMVNHKDGIKTNCDARNLEWTDAKGNGEHASQHDLINKGSKVPSSILTEKLIPEIRRRLANGDTRRVIAKDYNVHHTTIGCIQTGKTWRHVS